MPFSSFQIFLPNTLGRPITAQEDVANARSRGSGSLLGKFYSIQQPAILLFTSDVQQLQGYETFLVDLRERILVALLDLRYLANSQPGFHLPSYEPSMDDVPEFQPASLGPHISPPQVGIFQKIEDWSMEAESTSPVTFTPGLQEVMFKHYYPSQTYRLSTEYLVPTSLSFLQNCNEEDIREIIHESPLVDDQQLITTLKLKIVQHIPSENDGHTHF